MNQIQKLISNQESNFEKFLGKIELIYYDTEYTNDEEKIDQMDKIFEELVESEEVVDICRGNIDLGYIQDTFLEDDIMGYVAKIEGKYVGFILFKQVRGHFYLSLVGTRPKLGMPLGQILIAMMEQTAINRGIGIIEADSVAESLDFYKKHDWNVIEKDEEENTYFIKKQIIKGYVEIIEDPSDDDEDYYDSDSEDFEDIDFEEYANRDLEIITIHYERNFMGRIYDYVFSHF